MSSGRERDLMNARFTKTSVNDDEKLCEILMSLDQKRVITNMMTM